MKNKISQPELKISKIKINDKNLEQEITKVSEYLKSNRKIIIEYSDAKLLRKIEEKILEQFGEKPLEYGIISLVLSKP